MASLTKWCLLCNPRAFSPAITRTWNTWSRTESVWLWRGERGEGRGYLGWPVVIFVVFPSNVGWPVVIFVVFPSNVGWPVVIFVVFPSNVVLSNFELVSVLYTENVARGASVLYTENVARGGVSVVYRKCG